MITEFELDLDFNNEQSEVLTKQRPTSVDIYQQAINYGTKRGLSVRQVQEVMSNAIGDDVCEQAYETALAKYRTSTNQFPDEASQAREACLKELAEKQAKKEKRGNFWNKLVGGLNTINDTTKAMGANQTGENLGNIQDPNYRTPVVRDDETDVRILGMKPLVFAFVALGVVIAGGIAIAMLGKKASKPKVK